MDNQEKEEFKNYVVGCVNKSNDDAYQKTLKAYDKHTADVERIMSEVLPTILEKLQGKPNYWFPVLLNILNGIIVGLSIYLAIYLVG